MSARRARAPVAAEAPPLSAGFLAALPLFLAYELGLWLLPEHAARSSAELVVGRGLFLFGGRVQLARLALLTAAAAMAYARLRRRGSPGGRQLLRALARAAGVGILAGMLLGPLLFALLGWIGVEPVRAAPQPPRELFAALRLIGAAPWEELLFRVGLYGSLFLALRHLVSFLGLRSEFARYGAELGALLGSALLFAAFHLALVQRLLGTSGEPYDPALFAWRVSAGILLGGLFRWRGFGTAAWAHAVFNLGLALGIGAQ
ncbi:MAG: CPBP family intramembrane metalloprotease [Planctomycetes bacterium]|nr:CPBP family intramembrane metalloprotease [Planctomycetota bacterium]